jgi:hypothetical protein
MSKINDYTLMLEEMEDDGDLIRLSDNEVVCINKDYAKEARHCLTEDTIWDERYNTDYYDDNTDYFFLTKGE